MAGMANAAHEIDEIVQEHHEQRDLKEFFDGVRADYAKAQKMMDDQARMISIMSDMIGVLQRELAESQAREKKLRRGY
jgi:hypothetical protein